VSAYLWDWLNLLVRWLHVITGVAWIGASFYFIWLDNHLRPPLRPEDDARGVGGEVWSVHGGGFYHAQKYRVAPPELPEHLHWFKWEAYSTWLSGMFLLVLVYWVGAEVYLVDRGVADLSQGGAIAISAACIAGGWLVYDAVCRSPVARNPQVFAVILLLLCTLLAWGLTQWFGGRGAYMHFGAVLGTIMVANVFFVIIPGQKRMVEAAQRGETPDPEPGLRAKQRSVHNTYFTLPVLFVMTSNHYAMVYGHAWNWAILVGISLAGALIRVYFVARHRGSASPLPAVLAVAILLAIVAAIAPRPQPRGFVPVAFDEVRDIIAARCVACHAAEPTHPAFAAAPLGVAFDTDEQIRAEATRIHQQTVVAMVMPIGNFTGMTDAERKIIDRWYRGMEQ
jgi:uncharacterized membrane protein